MVIITWLHLFTGFVLGGIPNFLNFVMSKCWTDYCLISSGGAFLQQLSTTTSSCSSRTHSLFSQNGSNFLPNLSAQAWEIFDYILGCYFLITVVHYLIPFYTVYSNRIESIQRRFLKHVSYRLNININGINGKHWQEKIF